MLDNERRRLADQQGGLVRALMLGSAEPPGFDANQLQLCAQTLSRKRRRAMARAWPRLTSGLGERFSEFFTAYAAQYPLPQNGGPLADGRAFANWLKMKNALAEEGQWEALAVDMRFARTSAGLRPRRGPCVRIVKLCESRRYVIAWRLFGWEGHRKL